MHSLGTLHAMSIFPGWFNKSSFVVRSVTTGHSTLLRDQIVLLQVCQVAKQRVTELELHSVCRRKDVLVTIVPAVEENTKYN